MLFLTATPHSGDEEAFHNLLGMLDARFAALQGLPEGPERTRLREELARNFVQRRRPDIQEWKDSTVFPDRETAEATYILTGDWGRLFDAVLAYARTMVERAEGKSILHQRMNWWAALALLRCVSSSPAAAAVALYTRLRAVDGLSEDLQVAEIERTAAETVLDGPSDDELNIDETVPAGTTADAETNEADAQALRELIARAEALKGAGQGPETDGPHARGEAADCGRIPAGHLLSVHCHGSLCRGRTEEVSARTPDPGGGGHGGTDARGARGTRATARRYRRERGPHAGPRSHRLPE
jgi:hypothetical protein